MAESSSLDMNAILDEALDELDELDDDDEKVAESKKQSESTISLSPPSPPREPSPTSNTSIKETTDTIYDSSPQQKVEEEEQQSPSGEEMGESFHTMMTDFMEAQNDENDDDVDNQLQNFVQQVEAHFSPKNDGNSPKRKQQQQQQSESTSNIDSNDIEESLANILQEMAKAGLSDETLNQGGDGSSPSEEDILKKLFAAAAGDEDSSSFNPDAVIDGMMEELLSKDLMYEPMKEVTDKFPAWLEENKSILSPDDYQGRCRQFESFKTLVNTYETDPTNVTRLVDLMQQVQEFGQPPEEIIKDIAPGLELDGNGMPKINPLQGLGGNGDEDCIIM